MRKMFLFLVFLIIITQYLFSQVPQEITYQGRLKEYGEPVTGKRDIKLTIYDAQVDGMEKWSHTFSQVEVNAGKFTIEFYPQGLDWREQDKWIETTITDRVLSPRKKLTVQPYAVHAGSAEEITKLDGEIYFSIGKSTYMKVNTQGLEVNGTIRTQDSDSAKWREAYEQRYVWDGSSTTLNKELGRESLGLKSMSLQESDNVEITGGYIKNISSMTVTSGNVGIGVTNPSHKLEVNGTIEAENITIKGNPVESVGNLASVAMSGDYNDLENTPNVVYTSTIPAGEFSEQEVSNIKNKQLADGSQPWTVSLSEQETENRYLRKDIETVQAPGKYIGTDEIRARDSAGLKLYNSAGTNGIFVKDEGNVGIGTNSPSAALEVDGRIKDQTGFIIPVGTVLPFSGETVPSGYLYCNAQEVSRSTYSDLFDIIGTIYGDGDGVTTFNVPDYRGYFLRGWDNSAGNDPNSSSRLDRGNGTGGDVVGSKQLDATAVKGLHDTGHSHSGSTNSNGNHSHSGTTSSGGNHAHGFNDYVHAENDGTNNYNMTGSQSTDNDNEPISYFYHTTTDAGYHNHSLGTSTNGNHNHSFNTNSSSANLSGDSETRPININVMYIIRY